MAYDKVVDSAQLDADLLSIANAIREKSGTSEPLIFPADFENAIANLTASSANCIFEKVGTITVSYVATSLDLSSHSWHQDITIDDIYLVPLNFQVFHTGGATSGTITCGTYDFIKQYNASSGVFTAKRESVTGQVGINFDCDVYVYMETEGSGGSDVSITDDGNGNIIISGMNVTDDGSGNVAVGE